MRQEVAYKIVELTEEYYLPYFVCLELTSKDMKEAGDHKKCWYDMMKTKGLGVRLAIDDKKEPVGMIQYTPSQFNIIEGKNIYFINCIWLPKETQMRKKGIGRALLNAAEEDIRQRGASGVAAWGVSIPVFMQARWFKKYGYKKVDKKNIQVLLFKAFDNETKIPKWMIQKRVPQKQQHPGKITITAFLSGSCPVQNFNYERMKRIAREFPGKIEFQTISTIEPEVITEWGIADGLYVEDQCISNGPPMSYEKMRKKVIKIMKKLKI